MGGTLFLAGSFWTGTLSVLGFLDPPAQSAEVAESATSTIYFYRRTTLYSKDTEHVYYRGVVVQRADPDTFKIIGRPRVTRVPDDYYAADEKHVYYNGAYIRYADPEHFVFLKDKEAILTDYAKDKERVYDAYLGSVIKKADAKSFVVLNYWYGKDKNYVFAPTPKGREESGRVPILGADPATFKAVADPIFCTGDCTFDAQDKKHKYLRSEIVE